MISDPPSRQPSPPASPRGPRRTELRLRVNRLIALRLQRREVRARLAGTGWTPQMPMIPCEWDTPVGDVLFRYHRVLYGRGRPVLVPVLAEPGPGPVAITCLVLAGDGAGTLDPDRAGGGDPATAMARVLSGEPGLTLLEVVEADPDPRLCELIAAL